MMSEYLDDALRHGGFRNYAELARKLGVHRQQVDQ